MDDSTTTAPIGPASADAERRLVRPAEGRVVAGVCAGLGRYFDINPIVYRVALSALVLLGGSGLLLYAAAWLVIPDERRGESIVGEALRDHRSRPWLAIGVGLVGLALVTGISESRLWPDPGTLWLGALVVGLAVIWWHTHDRPAAPATATQPAPARRRVPVFSLTLGVLIAGAGVLGVLESTDAVDVDWTLALTVGVVLIGLAVAAGAFFGGVGLLAAVGALLAAAVLAVGAIDVPLDGPIGDRTERPSGVLDLDRAYRQSIGRLVVDLRELELPPGTTRVDASVGIGELVVRVPEEVAVRVDTHVTAGEALVFDTRLNGRSLDESAVREGTRPDAPTLEVDAEVGLGDLEVRRG